MKSVLRRFRVGGVPEHFNTPWHTAKWPRGLAIEWSNFHGGTGAMMKALRSNEIDVAIALTEGIVADITQKGTDVQLLGTYVSTPLEWGVHVAAASPLKAMTELNASCSYAVSRMGSGSHLMACVDAHARGCDPAELTFEIVGSLQGAREALGEGRADLFMWEKFTTKHLVDSAEWRRIGVVPTPWPCFSLAARADTIAESGPALLEMLDVVSTSAKDLRSSEGAVSTIAEMYGLQESDVTEWLPGVRWSCEPVVATTMLEQVTSALVAAGVLRPEELLPLRSLTSPLTRDT